MSYKLVSGLIIIDEEYLRLKKDLYNQVFKNYVVLGWYSTGKEVQRPGDLEIHKKIMDTLTESTPLYMQLDTTIAASAKEIPLVVYESETRMVENIPRIHFVPIQYKLETGEAEHISVEHVARISTSPKSAANSQVAAHLNTMHSAVHMLNHRVRALHDVLVAMAQGGLPRDHSLLRQIHGLSNRLPLIDTPKYREDFMLEYNDTALITYLAAMTKGSNSVNELVDKVNLAQDKPGRGRRGIF